MIGAWGGGFPGFSRVLRTLNRVVVSGHTAAGWFPELDSAAFGGVLVNSGTRIADSLISPPGALLLLQLLVICMYMMNCLEAYLWAFSFPLCWIAKIESGYRDYWTVWIEFT